MNVFEDQHAVLVSTWTHVTRRRSDAKVEDKDEKTHGVTASRYSARVLCSGGVI
jgi:hypothetical protein